jgi:serine/threonine protein phosphatase PrpC
LKDNLHTVILRHPEFMQNPRKAITDGCEQVDRDFLAIMVENFEETYRVSGNRQSSVNKAGSCGIVAFFVDRTLHICNVGDSRACASFNNGTKLVSLSVDHKPTEEGERKRITANGGTIYQTHSNLNGGGTVRVPLGEGEVP